MAIELKIPEVGESITEALIGQWFKAEGDSVVKDEPVVELETDKVTVELPAPATGVLSKIQLRQGDTAQVGEVIGYIEENGERAKAAPASTQQPATAPATAEPAEAAAPAAEPAVMPAARRLLEQHGLDATSVAASGPGGRLLKEDVERHLTGVSTPTAPAQAPPAAPPATGTGERQEETVAMSPIRKRIAERLVAAQSTAALLTTFNEVDMSSVIDLRRRYRESFQQKHGIKLGFMSFFVKACVDALRQFPQVNAEVRGTDIVYRNYYDIGMAVSTDRGLMVPVLRHAERLGFAEIEIAIADFATRARDGKIQLQDLEGGTFTITNGGIFGSMLSTPIVNPAAERRSRSACHRRASDCARRRGGDPADDVRRSDLRPPDRRRPRGGDLSQAHQGDHRGAVSSHARGLTPTSTPTARQHGRQPAAETRR